MGTNYEILPKAVVLFCIIHITVGCANLPKNSMASISTDYNIIVEKTQNEMLLLNIVRASKRHPMYFTDFNALRGNMSFNFGTGGVNIPFGKIGVGLNGAYSISPNVTYSTNPNFDIVVWNNQDFIRGMLSPVTMETFNYYWEQGWPKELLLHIFIRRIDKITNGGLIETHFNNYPENKEEFYSFQMLLRTLFFENSCVIAPRVELTSLGPEIDESIVLDLKNLIEVQKAGLMLEKVEEKEREKPKYHLKSKDIKYEFKCKGKMLLFDNRSISPDALHDETIYKIYLRSPEAILYYLGEIVRAEINNNFIPTIHTCASQTNKESPLFVVHKASAFDKPFSVSIEYEGDKYIIPNDLSANNNDGCLIDRSMHVLSLLSQLIGLQKKGDKAPVTGVVTVIDR